MKRYTSRNFNFITCLIPGSLPCVEGINIHIHSYLHTYVNMFILTHVYKPTSMPYVALGWFFSTLQPRRLFAPISLLSFEYETKFMWQCHFNRQPSKYTCRSQRCCLCSDFLFSLIEAGADSGSLISMRFFLPIKILKKKL